MLRPRREVCTAVQWWEGTVRVPLVDMIRCERRSVSTHPACAIDYSEWSGKVGEPGGLYGKLDIRKGSLLCCKCFDEHLTSLCSR